MAIWKKILLPIFFMFLLFSVGGTSASGRSQEAAVFFHLYDATTTGRYAGYRPITYMFQNRSVTFTFHGDTTLHLFDDDRNQYCLSFPTYHPEDQNNVDYEIRPLYTTSPELAFFEIMAYTGSPARTCGYWIIGKAQGTWTTYVSFDSLIAMGLTPNQVHRITTEVIDGTYGNLILTSTHYYMPFGRTDPSQYIRIPDLIVELYWEPSSQWFGSINMRPN